mgnify:CR=1 FL=1
MVNDDVLTSVFYSLSKVSLGGDEIFFKWKHIYENLEVLRL